MKPTIKKNTRLAQAIKKSPYKIPAIIQRAEITRGRFYRLCNGAKPYHGEADRIAIVLGIPVSELF